MATYWENSCSFGLRYVSWYKYLIVSLVFTHLGFWSGNLFLIAPFPDLCLLVPFYLVIVRLSVMRQIIFHIFLQYLIVCDWAFFRGYSIFQLLVIVSRVRQWLQQNIFGLEHRKTRHQYEQRTNNLARCIL